MFNDGASLRKDGEALMVPSLMGHWDMAGFVVTVCWNPPPLHIFPSLISIFTGLLIDVMFHFPSHRGSLFTAIGTDSYTGSPTENWGSE